jgi:DNA-binding response OmpR family regulator
MARAFIFDSDLNTAMTIAFGLESQGYEVLTNIDTDHQANLDTTKVIRKMLTWEPEPDVIIIECLDVDSEKFLEILATTTAKKATVIAMTHRYPNNTKLKRLMKDYGVLCMEKPLNIAKFVEYVEELQSA